MRVGARGGQGGPVTPLDRHAAGTKQCQTLVHGAVRHVGWKLNVKPCLRITVRRSIAAVLKTVFIQGAAYLTGAGAFCQFILRLFDIDSPYFVSTK